MSSQHPSRAYQIPKPRHHNRITLRLLACLLSLPVLVYALTPHYTICDFTPHRMHATDLQNLKTALTAFQLDTGRFPTTAEGLQALTTQPNSAPGWNGPYMDAIPLDEWQHPYIYRSPGTQNPTTFDLLSPGPDGIEATPDDIAARSPWQHSFKTFASPNCMNKTSW